MQIIYIAMRCLDFFEQGNLNGYILKSLIQINAAAIVSRDVF